MRRCLRSFSYLSLSLCFCLSRYGGAVGVALGVALGGALGSALGSTQRVGAPCNGVFVGVCLPCGYAAVLLLVPLDVQSLY